MPSPHRLVFALPPAPAAKPARLDPVARDLIPAGHAGRSAPRRRGWPAPGVVSRRV